MRSPLLGLAVVSMIVFLLSSFRDELPNKVCQENHGTFCTAVQNNCFGIGTCFSCLSTARNALCDGETGTCKMKTEPQGCGNLRVATCDGLTCVNWQISTQLFCDRDTCDYGTPGGGE